MYKNETILGFNMELKLIECFFELFVFKKLACTIVHKSKAGLCKISVQWVGWKIQLLDWSHKS